VTTLPDPKFTYQQFSVGSPKPFAGYDWLLQDPKDLPIAEVRAIRDEIRHRVESLISNEWIEKA
jgi:hypothetical protein